MTKPRQFAAILLLSGVGTLAYLAAYQSATNARFDLGSMDWDYLYREEQFHPRVRMNGPQRLPDGRVENVEFYGRLTRRFAVLTLPYRVYHSSIDLRLRAHRFGLDGVVTLKVNGESVGDFFTERGFPWETLSVTVPAELAGRGPLTLEVRALNRDLPQSHLPSDLGIGLDWIEVEAKDPDATFMPPARGWIGAFLLPLLGFVFLRWTGTATRLSLLCAGAGSALFIFLTAIRPIETTMALMRVWVFFPLALGLYFVLTRLRDRLQLTPADVRFITGLFLLSQLAHSALIFFPNHAPADIWTHLPKVTWLNEHDLTMDNLFRYSTAGKSTWSDLTSIDGYRDGHVRLPSGTDHGAPYPPFFYFLVYGATRVYGDALFLLEAVPLLLGGLMVVLTFVIAKDIWNDGRVARLAGVLMALEISLWHHIHRVHGPGVLGAVCVLLLFAFLVLRHETLARKKGLLTLGAVTALALLSYTASVIQLAILSGWLIVLVVASRRDEDRRLVKGLLSGFALGASVAFSLYYGPYAFEAMVRKDLILERGSLDIPASYYFLRNQMRDTVRILMNGYPVYVALSACGLAVLGSSSAGSFHRRLLWASVLTYATMLLFKDPALLPRVFLHAKEDLFYAPVACLLGGYFLATLAARSRMAVVAILVLLAALQIRDQRLNANTLNDQRVAAAAPADANTPVETAPLTTENPAARAGAAISVLEANFDPGERQLTVRLSLTNTGEAAWFHQQRESGWVSIALRTDPFGADDFCEALPRHRLTRTVAPGETVERELVFHVPSRCSQDEWYVDMVNEGYFWFSHRGTAPVKVSLR